MKRVSSKTVIIAVCFLIIFFYALAMILGLQEPSRGGRPAASEKGGSGYYVLYTLLERLDYDLHRVRSLPSASKQGSLIYLSWTGAGRMNREKLAAWVRRGNVLFLLGIAGEEDPLLELELREGAEAEVHLTPPAGAQEVLSGVQTSQCFSAAGESRIFAFTPEGPVWVGSSLGQGYVYLLSDAALLNNEQIGKEELALLFTRLLAPVFTSPLYFYEETITGETLANPVLIFFRGRLFFVTLHLLLMSGLFLYWRGKRFRGALVYAPYARRSLAEHIQAVGRFFMKTGSPALICRLEAAYFAFLLRKHGNWLNLKEEQLAETAARRYGLDPQELAELLQAPAKPDNEMLLARVKRCRDIIKQITHE